MSENRRMQEARKSTGPRLSGDFEILLNARSTPDSDGVLNWDERVPIDEWEGVDSDPEAVVLHVLGLNLA